MTALLWFRHDLRVHDHPALHAAVDSNDDVVPVFCFDRRLLGGRHRSASRVQFLLECLEDLDSSLRGLGSALILRSGDPAQELVSLAREVSAQSVHVSADVGPFARRRDEGVGRALAATGVELCSHPGLFTAADPGAIRSAGGHPYTVFSPYHRAWLWAPRRDVLSAPRSLPPVPRSVPRGKLPRLSQLGLEQEVSDPALGGEEVGRQRLRKFLRSALSDYESERNSLGDDATSRLSPYLHFGCLSPREIEHRLPPGRGAEAFRRQLCWRDFYAQVLLHHARNAHSEYQDRYRGSLGWSYSQRRFAAWCEGRTGYPLVDAGMRQLRREGWMHNRARLVVGSFLTKDLGIDWRWGERWFMRFLLDGDEANNNGNWQWIASVGVDPEPPSRRMFNPSRQQARFDPDGSYVRRYVPELERVPGRFLAEPWKMPDEVQAEARCVIGEDYPEPIVEHAEARQAALARYAAAGRVGGS
jgi:deoxyribodipyrimidine photo-lyase